MTFAPNLISISLDFSLDIFFKEPVNTNDRPSKLVFLTAFSVFQWMPHDINFLIIDRLFFCVKKLWIFFATTGQISEIFSSSSIEDFCIKLNERKCISSARAVLSPTSGIPSE